MNREMSPIAALGRETARKNRSVLRSKANGRVKKSDLTRDLGPGTVIQSLLKLRR